MNQNLEIAAASFEVMAKRNWGYSTSEVLIASLHEQLEAYGSEPVEVAPFNDDMTKAEMVEHLMDVHNVPRGTYIRQQSFGPGTKITKDQMIAFHNAEHVALDEVGADTQIDYRGARHQRDGEVVHQFTIGNAFLPRVNHRHTAVALSSDQSEALVAVRSNQRAGGILSVADRKVLTELVNNDFGSLKQEMRAFASDTLSAKQREINADWDSKEESIPDYAEQATDLQRKYEDDLAAMKAKHAAEERVLTDKRQDAVNKIITAASKKGVELAGNQEHVTEQDGSRKYRTVFAAEVKGRKEALAAAAAENKSFLDRALLDLEKQRLTAQRQVLLSGVPEKAMPIVESIPDAKTLMVEAQQQRSAKQINA